MSRPIDRRWSQRRDTHLEVTISGKELAPQHGVCRNIGAGGLYVQTDPPGLVIDSVYHVSFTLGQGDEPQYQRVAARAIRRASDGFALMFTEFPLDSLRMLRRLLYEEAPECSAQAAPVAERRSDAGTPRSSVAGNRRRHKG